MTGADALAGAARRFWRWRAAQQPCSGDDIPRIERPDGWVPDWSPRAVCGYRAELAAMTGAYRRLPPPDPVADAVDHRLLGSALDRVYWELELLRSWQRDPGFYVDQALGPIFGLLLRPPPFDPPRAAAVAELLDAVPRVFEDGAHNLAGQAGAAFAAQAASRLARADERLLTAAAALEPFLPSAQHARQVASAARDAARAVARFRAGLAAHAGNEDAAACVRPQDFAFFLHRVALLPYTADEILALARPAFDRARARELIELHAARAVARPRPPASAVDQVAAEAAAEAQLRGFLHARGLLTLPASLPRYRWAPIPPYLAPLSWLGITDDLTGPRRRGDDAVSYIPDPGPRLPYFDLANTLDPRLGIAHEGAHYYQLALSWDHPRPARRRYYDSAPNEGLACYHEELLVSCGLYADAPWSRAWVYGAMGLRALRAQVDVGLASGGLDVAAAAALLRERAGLDAGTAGQEAVFFASTPGQALSYEVGRTQVTGLLADAARREGGAFALGGFHDYLWRNGNVPLSLVRWEYLGDRGDLDRADALAAGCEPV